MAIWLLLLFVLVERLSAPTRHVGRMPLPREQVVALLIVLVALAHLLAAWLVVALRGLGRLLGSRRQRGWLEHPVALALLALPLLAAPPLYWYARHIEPERLVTRTVPLGWPREDTRPLRLAVISDLHVDGARSPFTELAAKVNATDPDLILLLGDLLNTPAGLAQLQSTLAAMHAPLGKLAVRGNWENWYWSQLPLLKGTGFEWLEGAHPTLEFQGQRVHLAGLGHRDRDPLGEASRLIEAMPTDGWRLFLYHTPDLVEEIPAVDLYLCGHTHGGQIWVPGFGALVTLSKHGKRYERGLRSFGMTRIYTHPGIGVEPAIPLRLGVPPEVTVFELWPRSATTTRDGAATGLNAAL